MPAVRRKTIKEVKETGIDNPAEQRRAEQRKKILEALQAGNTRAAACAFAGLDQSTFGIWCKHDPDFSQAVIDAEGRAEAGFVTAIAIAAKKGKVEAAKFWLERRRPEEWGMTSVVRFKVSKEVENILASLQLTLDSDTYERVLDSLTSSGAVISSASLSQTTGSGETSEE